MLVHRGIAQSLAFLAAAIAFSLACSGEKSPAARADLVAIHVLPAAAGPLPIPLGTSVRFAATGTFSDGATRDVTAEVVWSSSAPAVDRGLERGGERRRGGRRRRGASEIAATDPATGVTSRVPVEVVAAQVVSLAVSPIGPTLLVGTTLQLEANATLSDETVADLAASVTWTSSDPAIASVSENGLVTAMAVGIATITAERPVSLAEDSTTVEVTAVPSALSYVALSRGSVIGGGRSRLPARWC